MTETYFVRYNPQTPAKFAQKMGFKPKDRWQVCGYSAVGSGTKPVGTEYDVIVYSSHFSEEEASAERDRLNAKDREMIQEVTREA